MLQCPCFRPIGWWSLPPSRQRRKHSACFETLHKRGRSTSFCCRPLHRERAVHQTDVLMPAANAAVGVQPEAEWVERLGVVDELRAAREARTPHHMWHGVLRLVRCPNLCSDLRLDVHYLLWHRSHTPRLSTRSRALSNVGSTPPVPGGRHHGPRRVDRARVGVGLSPAGHLRDRTVRGVAGHAGEVVLLVPRPRGVGGEARADRLLQRDERVEYDFLGSLAAGTVPQS